MNGHRSPKSVAQAAGADDDAATTRGVSSTGDLGSASRKSPTVSDSGESRRHSRESEVINGPKRKPDGPVEGDGDEDAASEAETLINSPVKTREAAKQNTYIKREKPLRSRIGGLPVPGEDDESSVASPMPSTETSVDKTGSGADAHREDTADVDNEVDDDNVSDLSSARSTPSQASSRSRAFSERPDNMRHGASPNPRKRKYRASSVGLPRSKRQSVDPPRSARYLRGMHSDESNTINDRSASPKTRMHRRTVSTQSTFETGPEGGHRRRRINKQHSSRDHKPTPVEWGESDVSSETTSRAGDDTKRPQRQVVRSTSTPGRPSHREQKRHVNKYGFTRLAEACETGDLEAVKEWRIKDPDQVELAEFAGNKPLQIAALNGNSEVVEYLIKEGCQIDCANADKDTPLIDAAENGHLEVVRLLLDAGVDPLRQNLKGQQALDVLTEDIEDVKDIRAALREAIDRWNSDDAKQRREEEEIQRHRGGPSKELHLMARTYDNLLKLVMINDRKGVQEFLDARVPVDNNVIAAAAKTGDSYLLSMLLAEMTEKKAFREPEKPMLAVLGTSHFEMVKLLTELEQFNPLWRSSQNKSWPELAEERNGPMWRQERDLLQRLFEKQASSKERRSSSPVSKREANGKRRGAPWLAADEHDDADALAAPKRKNGRRLMSRKDMRAANSKVHLFDSSDGEDDSSDNNTPGRSEDAPAVKGEENNSMPPPSETPNTRRASGRTRSKSISSQVSETSPRTRRSSLSLRGDSTLAKVEEKSEISTKKTRLNDDDSSRHNVEAAIMHEKELVRQAEVKRVEEEKEEARKAEQARVEANRRQQEEEQEQRREEQRRAEEARLQEEARAAEAARAAERERLRKEQELAEAKRQLRSDLLSSLPSVLYDALNPDSSLWRDGITSDRLATYLLRHFTPLRPVSVMLQDARKSEQDEWILNLQAAPLLGELGLELFFDPDSLGFAGSLAERLTTAPLAAESRHVVDQILTSLVDVPAKGSESAMNGDRFGIQHPQSQRSMQRTAERYNAFIAARRRLELSTHLAVLRCVRLDDVLRNLHPSLLDHEIEVTSMYTEETASPRTAGQANVILGGQDFVGRLEAYWNGRRPPRAVKGIKGGTEPNGKHCPSSRTVCSSLSDIVVVHEK